VGVRARGGAGRREQCEPAAPALVPQAAGALLGGVEAELVGVERSGAVEVLGRQSRGDVAVLEHEKSMPPEPRTGRTGEPVQPDGEGYISIASATSIVPPLAKIGQPLARLTAPSRSVALMRL